MLTNTSRWMICQINLIYVVDVVFIEKRHGVLSLNTSLNKQDLCQYILHNKRNNTGFLLWISTYCLSCIFQHRAKGRTKFVVSAFDDSETPHLFQVLDDIDSLINIICSIVSYKFAGDEGDEAHYQIQFLLCLCQLTRSDRQKLIRKDKSL